MASQADATGQVPGQLSARCAGTRARLDAIDARVDLHVARAQLERAVAGK